MKLVKYFNVYFGRFIYCKDGVTLKFEIFNGIITLGNCLLFQNSCYSCHKSLPTRDFLKRINMIDDDTCLVHIVTEKVTSWFHGIPNWSLFDAVLIIHWRKHRKVGSTKWQCGIL